MQCPELIWCVNQLIDANGHPANINASAKPRDGWSRWRKKVQRKWLRKVWKWMKIYWITGISSYFDEQPNWPKQRLILFDNRLVCAPVSMLSNTISLISVCNICQVCFQNYCPTQYLLLGFSRDTCKSIRSVSLTINEIVTARPNPGGVGERHRKNPYIRLFIPWII